MMIDDDAVLSILYFNFNFKFHFPFPFRFSSK